MTLKPAYPYFGSKAAVAARVWDAFGAEVANYVEPFCGSAAVLLARPAPGKIETVNDAHCYIPCFLRAVQRDPEEVAYWATWPVSEVDMHARHAWLLDRANEAFREQMRDDPDFYDAQVAGWWVWGASIWIGSGWCTAKERENQKHSLLAGHAGGAREGYPKDGVGIFRGKLSQQLPNIGASTNPRAGKSSGRGIFRERLPHLIGPHNGRKHQGPHLTGSDGSGVGYGRGIFASGRREDIAGYFGALAERLARVRITCGDWSRVVTPAVTISHGLTAVLLDPPYGAGAGKRAKLYAEDSDTVSTAVREWAIAHGDDPRYRIALCGYEEEHGSHMPSSWRVLAWKTNGGYGNQDRENANAARERVWFSPYCLGGEKAAGPLFASVGGVE